MQTGYSGIPESPNFKITCFKISFPLNKQPKRQLVILGSGSKFVNVTMAENCVTFHQDCITLNEFIVFIFNFVDFVK